MTDFDRNMRTCIACFVIAILSLTALRFAEVKNLIDVSSSQVLGETVQKEVVLPNAEIPVEVTHANYIGN